MAQPISLSRYLTRAVEAQHIDQSLARLVEQLARAAQHIAHTVAGGALYGVLGEAGQENIQGEAQKKLDVLSNDIMINALDGMGDAAALASEEMEWPLLTGTPQAPYLVLFDPLDGSSNIDINAPIGTIFSILPRPQNADFSSPQSAVGAFLQAGTAQRLAGYVLYGSSTVLTLTFGQGTDSFTLDRGRAEFILTQAQRRIDADTAEFAINMSNQRHWEAPVRRYIDELLAGKTGVRGKDFNMRWVAAMVADVHRVLSRGGVFMYPKDAKNAAKGGKLRLMYEANPMAWLVEQAGGAASNGTQRILDIEPEKLHQRVSVMLGASHEIQRLGQYHQQ